MAQSSPSADLIRSVPAKRTKFLIITADDFGLHESVNAAVELASTLGALTAASLMVGAPAAPDAIRRARALPGLRVGLHVVLTDGQSVLPHEAIPALVDESGRFRGSMFRNGVRFFAMPRVRLQLESEIRAQFEAFHRSGLPLDHVNAHKHFHLHPTVLRLILNIGRDFGLKAIRVPHEPPPPGTPFLGRAGSALLRPWVELLRHRLRARGIQYNDRVYGIHFSGAMDETQLLTVLKHLPEGITEIYLHPAAARNDLTGSTSEYRHQDELTALLSAEVRSSVQSSGARCGGYSDLSGFSTGA